MKKIIHLEKKAQVSVVTLNRLKPTVKVLLQQFVQFSICQSVDVIEYRRQQTDRNVYEKTHIRGEFYD